METLNFVIVSILISVLWGLSGLIQRLVLDKLQYPTVLVLTSAFYFLTLLPYIVHNNTAIVSDIRKLDQALIKLFLINAIFFVLIPNLLYYKLAKDHNIGILSLLTSTYPLWTLLAFSWATGKMPSKSVIFASVLIMAGMIFVTCNEDKTKN